SDTSSDGPSRGTILWEDVEAFPGRRLPQSIVERDEAAAGYWCTRAMRVPDALSRYSRIWVRVLLGSPAIRLRGMKLLSFLILNSPASARCQYCPRLNLSRMSSSVVGTRSGVAQCPFRSVKSSGSWGST